MLAHLINGNFISQQIRTNIANRAATLTAQGKQPGLAMILVGNNEASQIYVNNKIKSCKNNGLYSVLENYDIQITETNLLTRINTLNNNSKIHGILVQLPLPKHINTYRIIEEISIKKDVDCFHNYNTGLLLTGKPLFYPCTPYGIMKILEYINYPISGAHAVIVGASNIVGKPQAILLLQAGATITVCNSKTKNLRHYTRQADILIVAIGKPKIITADMVKIGAVVIDVGINRDENGKLCGDVDFIHVQKVASYITPTPGGVGPMTITMLLANTIKAAEQI